MFQFPGFAQRLMALCQDRSWRVSPFGHPRVAGHLPLAAAFRSLSRPSSPPRATGIPHAPFLSFLSSSRSDYPTQGGRLSVVPYRPSVILSLDCSLNSISSLRFQDSRALTASGKEDGALLFLYSSRSQHVNDLICLFSVVPGRLELPTSTLSV